MGEGDRSVQGRSPALLAYLYLDGSNFNRLLLEKGLARVYDASFSLRDEFHQIEEPPEVKNEVCRPSRARQLLNRYPSRHSRAAISTVVILIRNRKLKSSSKRTIPTQIPTDSMETTTTAKRANHFPEKEQQLSRHSPQRLRDRSTGAYCLSISPMCRIRC